MTTTDTTTSDTTTSDAPAGSDDVGTTTADAERAIDTYLAAYGEPDAATRARLVAEVFADDAVLADPPFLARGHDELVGAFAAVQERFPGHRFERTSRVDVHHDVARCTWALGAPDGEPALVGTDVVAFRDGRIARVHGFFGDVTPR